MPWGLAGACAFMPVSMVIDFPVLSVYCCNTVPIGRMLLTL
ncbi:hypothetical protein EMIT0111MI5_80250 [Burkholderia sp. IT-111MI5]